MKMQQLSSFLLWCSLFACSLLYCRTTRHKKVSVYSNKELASLHAPIIFSSSGIKDFIKNVYDKHEYTQEVLPNEFSHLLQLLEHGLKTGKKRTYSKSVLRLFMSAEKRVSYISAYAYDDMLTKLPSLMLPHVNSFIKPEKELSRMVYDLLYSSISSNFNYFKTRPQEFLTNLSQDVIRQLSENYIPDSSVEELRAMVLRFLEAGLSKLVWHPGDGIETWESVKNIADHLAELANKDIITDLEDLNDLFISLLERYIFFLDISNDALPLTFYKEIKEDISNNSTVLLELEEQEEFITPKVYRLLRAVNVGQAKVRSRDFTRKVC